MKRFARMIQFGVLPLACFVACGRASPIPSGSDVRKSIERHSEPTIVGTWRLKLDRNVPLDVNGKELWPEAKQYPRGPDVNVITYRPDGTWISKSGKGPAGHRLYDYDHGTYVRHGKELTKRAVDGFTQTLTIEVLDDQDMVLRWRYSDFHDYNYFERVR